MGIDTGTLRVGALADVCIFDPEHIWTIDSTTWESSGRNTPYWGQTVKGRVTHTLLNGRLIFELQPNRR
jgi:dihydroorotase